MFALSHYEDGKYVIIGILLCWKLAAVCGSLGEHQKLPQQAQKLPGSGQVLDRRIWDNPEKIRHSVDRKLLGLIVYQILATN